jgi:hypothetical protein
MFGVIFFDTGDKISSVKFLSESRLLVSLKMWVRKDGSDNHTFSNHRKQ